MVFTILGEELLFRGYLLPRMNGAFGRGDWVVNGLLFTVYHLHVPWAMPATLLDIVHPGLPDQALPERLDRDRGAQRPERFLRAPHPRTRPLRSTALSRPVQVLWVPRARRTWHFARKHRSVPYPSRTLNPRVF